MSGEERRRGSYADQNAVIGALAVLLRTPGRSLKDDLSSIAQGAADFLQVTRAGVWLFNEDRTVLECACQYDRATGGFSSGQRLVAEECPTYVEACADVQVLSAPDVMRDPRTRELRDYFVESGIAALLDAPVFVGADALGVVCHEDAGEPRTWTAKEQAFAASVAQLAANSVAANRWRLREEALRRSEARYRSMVQDVTDYVVRSDHTGRILHVNSAVGVAHGTDPDELRGSTVFDMAPPGEHHIFLDAVRATTPESPVARYCHHVLHNDGSQGLVEWASRTFFGEDGKPTGYRAIGRDITEQRKREESLREAQRLEALALFAGGMAHDLNNLLLPILVLTDSVLAGLGPDSPESEDLREVSRAAIRARSLGAVPNSVV